ncbi:MAG: NUMOD3 domain-containing DNA-binding protein [Beijerinckiaceae bacterium]|jgi:hypothetical protein
MSAALSTFYVYVYFHPATGQPCYVGKGRGERWLGHLNGRGKSNPHLRNTIKKYGGTPCVKVREGLTEAEAFEAEIAFIRAIGRAPDGPLFNLTDGGDGASGAVRSAETRAKMSAAISAALKGRVPSPETRAKLSAAGMGRTASAETRAKLSAANKVRIFSLETRAKLSAAASNQSPETRAKIGAAHKGRIHSDETRTKMSAAQRGRIFSDEHRANLSAAISGANRRRLAFSSQVMTA